MDSIRAIRCPYYKCFELIFEWYTLRGSCFDTGNHLPVQRKSQKIVARSGRRIQLSLSLPRSRLPPPRADKNSAAVCAVLNPVWGFQHLISANLLSLDYVSTNNGTRDKYLIFSPRLLLDAERASVMSADLVGRHLIIHTFARSAF